MTVNPITLNFFTLSQDNVQRKRVLHFTTSDQTVSRKRRAFLQNVGKNVYRNISRFQLISSTKKIKLAKLIRSPQATYQMHTIKKLKRWTVIFIIANLVYSQMSQMKKVMKKRMMRLLICVWFKMNMNYSLKGHNGPPKKKKGSYQ